MPSLNAVLMVSLRPREQTTKVVSLTPAKHLSLDVALMDSLRLRVMIMKAALNQLLYHHQQPCLPWMRTL
jgi:hypothetical protein